MQSKTDCSSLIPLFPRSAASDSNLRSRNRNTKYFQRPKINMFTNRTTPAIVIAFCLLAFLLSCCKKDGSRSIPPIPAVPAEERFLEENEEIKAIQQKLKAHELQKDENGDLIPHQFIHLHHMKTGGTSIDHMLKCAMKRLEDDWKLEVPYYNIHECARGKFRQCVNDEDDICRERMKESSMMSYCAPLYHLENFGWMEDSVRALTVLRHPVDRVWSMFRFEPRSCYRCKNLTDIYALMDANTTIGYDSLCLNQLQNHEVRNLLTSDWPDDASDEDKLNEAIANLKSFFTVIGLTEELEETRSLLGKVFPWMDVKIEGSSTTCHLPHDNKSPENNHCVRYKTPDGKWKSEHWDLPDHPDEETRKAIEAHNQLDMKLYDAAVQYFELQKRAMDLAEDY